MGNPFKRKKLRKAVGVSTMGMFGGKKEKSDDGMRAEAAGRMVKVDKTKQAGSGQIKYNSEEWQE